jgi:osmotically-inducible protein OsmY
MTRRGPRSIGATRLMTKPPWLAILAVIYCTGCPQMLIMKGATTAASVIADDRTLSEQATDLELKEGIEQKFVSAAPTLASQVNVDVYLEHVMLTGVVGDWSDRRMAVALAREAASGHEIYDDIEVATGSGLADSAADFATNKELGVNLLADDGLASQSLQHRVVNGTAFIIGEADDPSLIETAREVARQTPGVQRVVTHIMVER